MAKSKLHVQRLLEVYQISNSQGEKIKVELKSNGKINLADENDECEFYFINSDPKRVRRIAEMMIEASKLLEPIKLKVNKK